MKEIKTPSIDGKIIQQLNVEKLTTKYPPKEIEKALVNIFIKEREIELKNDFIRKKYLEAKEEIVEEVYSHLKKMNKELDLMLLEKYFESLLEKEQSGGAYYTPYFIVDFIVKNTIKKDTDIKIIDPACGSGSFLVGGSRELDSLSKKNLLQILEENIFGIDISENAIRRSKIILNLFALTNGIEDEYIDLNLVQANSLSLDFKEEFPNIFEEGGFDIVIGNPPYAPIPSYYNTDSMNDRYNTINSENKKGNLYLPFLELMMEISKDDNSRCGHIIPLSLSYHSGKMFQKFRKIIQESEDEWYFSFYDRSPDSLFGDNIRTRNSIIFLKKRKESRTRVHSTKMIRWNSNERDILFNKISYADISNLSIKEGIPKVSSELEVKVLKKLRSTFHLRNYLTNKETGSNNNLYFYSTAYNWLPIFIDIPDSYNREGEKFTPSSINVVTCKSDEILKQIYAILNSMIAYWYWLVKGDGFHLNKSFLYDFPITPMYFSDSSKNKINDLAEKISQTAHENYITTNNNGLQIGNYNKIKCLEYISKVDKIIIDELSFEKDFYEFLIKRLWEHISAGRDDFKNKEELKKFVKGETNGKI